MLDELRDLYQEVILDHGKDSRNFRKPDNANCEASGHNPLCGDRLVVYLSVDDSNIVQMRRSSGTAVLFPWLLRP